MKYTFTPIFVAALLTLWAAASAEAAPGKTPFDTVVKFFNCAKAKPCADADVFVGHAFKKWQKVKPSLARIKITNTALVPSLGKTKFAAKWARRWAKAADRIAKLGYNRTALMKLGNGKSVVIVGPRVALVFASLDYDERGQTMTEHLIMTLFKQKDGWRITLIQDLPGRHVKFLRKNKP